MNLSNFKNFNKNINTSLTQNLAGLAVAKRQTGSGEIKPCLLKIIVNFLSEGKMALCSVSGSLRNTALIFCYFLIKQKVDEIKTNTCHYPLLIDTKTTKKIIN